MMMLSTVDAESVTDTTALCGNEVVASGVRAADALQKELLVEVSCLNIYSRFTHIPHIPSFSGGLTQLTFETLTVLIVIKKVFMTRFDFSLYT